MQLRTASSSIEANINVTPLVDVCLVLLIIFMVVTPMMIGEIPVHLPKSSTSGALGQGEQLKITVNADGTVFLNSLAVRAEQVAGEVQRLHAAKPAMNVVVRGDKAVPYGEVVKVLDSCRAAGYQDVGLVSEGRP
jgi:biopolymer transport protein ExbD